MGGWVDAVESCGATPPVGLTHQNFLTSLPFPPLFRAPRNLAPPSSSSLHAHAGPAVLCSPLACVLRSLSLVYRPQNVSPRRGGHLSSGRLPGAHRHAGAQVLLNTTLLEGENEGK